MDAFIYRDFGSGENGFTLIEVIVLIVVIDILASIVALKLLSQPDIASHFTATVSVLSPNNAPQLCQLQHNRFSSHDEASRALIRPNGGSTSYLYNGYPDKVAWIVRRGNTYSYQSPAQFGGNDLICFKKGLTPGEDEINADITFW